MLLLKPPLNPSPLPEDMPLLKLPLNPSLLLEDMLLLRLPLNPSLLLEDILLLKPSPPLLPEDTPLDLLLNNSNPLLLLPQPQLKEDTKNKLLSNNPLPSQPKLLNLTLNNPPLLLLPLPPLRLNPTKKRPLLPLPLLKRATNKKTEVLITQTTLLLSLPPHKEDTREDTLSPEQPRPLLLIPSATMKI